MQKISDILAGPAHLLYDIAESPACSLHEIDCLVGAKQELSNSPARFFYKHHPKMDPSKIAPDEQLSRPLLGKINRFVRSELSLDPDRFVFFIDSKTISWAESTGSLRQGCRGIVHFSPEFTREMETDFNDEHKFVIAHEISHLLNGDDSEKQIDRDLHIAQLHVSIFFLMILSTGLLICFPPLLKWEITAPLLVYPTSAATAGMVKEIRKRQLSRFLESQADLRAARFSLEIARGGIKVFEKARLTEEQRKSEFIEKLNKVDVALQQEPSCCKRGARGCFTRSLIRIAKLFPAELFFNIKCPSHPIPRHRIAAIQQVLYRE